MFCRVRHEIHQCGILLTMKRNISATLSLFSNNKAPRASNVKNVFEKHVWHSPSFPDRHDTERKHMLWFRTFVHEISGT